MKKKLAAAAMFAVVNVMLGTSVASAGFDDDVCFDPDAGTKACCPSCSTNCECNMKPGPGEENVE